MDYPALRLDIDRTRASELGLNQLEVVDNVITALTSNGIIAPSLDRTEEGNDYMLTVQYSGKPNHFLVRSLSAIPLKAAGSAEPTRLNMISSLRRTTLPRRLTITSCAVLSIFIFTGRNTNLGKIANKINGIIPKTKVPEGLTVTLRGSVQGIGLRSAASPPAFASQWSSSI